MGIPSNFANFSYSSAHECGKNNHHGKVSSVELNFTSSTCSKKLPSIGPSRWIMTLSVFERLTRTTNFHPPSTLCLCSLTVYYNLIEIFYFSHAHWRLKKFFQLLLFHCSTGLDVVVVIVCEHRKFSIKFYSQQQTNNNV